MLFVAKTFVFIVKNATMYIMKMRIRTTQDFIVYGRGATHGKW